LRRPRGPLFMARYMIHGEGLPGDADGLVRPRAHLSVAF
jgi:hypothetical protein